VWAGSASWASPRNLHRFCILATRRWSWLEADRYGASALVALLGGQHDVGNGQARYEQVQAHRETRLRPVRLRVGVVTYGDGNGAPAICHLAPGMACRVA
jgi:hypothetical protein